MKKKALILIAVTICLPWICSNASMASLDLSVWLPSKFSDSSTSQYQAYHSNAGNRYRSSSPFNAMDVKYDGEIRVGDSDRTIKSISPGGYLKISVRTFGNSRELLVNSNSTGKLSYEFREGRKEIPFEPEGRIWLEDVLLDVVRSSGVDAGGRTERIYARGGIDGVMDELSEIRSNNVKSMYFSALLEKQELTKRERSDLAYGIVGKISSNTDKGRLFRKYKDVFLGDPEVAAAYFSAISRVTSDTEKGRIYRDINRQLDFSNYKLTEAYFAGINRISSNTEASSVLRHTIANQELTVSAQSKLLGCAAKLSSDTESGRVLRDVGKLDFSQAAIHNSYFAAVDHISSSTEKGSVLRDVLAKNELEGPAMIAFLTSTRKISSSTEISLVMRAIQKIDLSNAGIRETYFDVVRTTASTSESGRMLRYTLETHSLNQAALINLYQTNQRISSSTEVSSVLRTSIPFLIYEYPVLEAFFSCTNLIASSTEQGRVLRQLAVEGKLNNSAITGLLHSAQKISSNTEKGSVLRAIAPRIKQGDKQLKDLYMESAKTLSSDYEFRRAMDAIM